MNSLLAWIPYFQSPKNLGERGEIAAARFLKRVGYRIVTTRLRKRYGEIDIIAVDYSGGSETVVFAEVKTRRRDDNTQPAEAVDSIASASPHPCCPRLFEGPRPAGLL